MKEVSFMPGGEVMTYKNYYGGIDFSIEDKCYHGKLLGVKDLISYEGNNIDKLKEEFKKAVDDYIEICEKIKKRLE